MTPDWFSQNGIKTEPVAPPAATDWFSANGITTEPQPDFKADAEKPTALQLLLAGVKGGIDTLNPLPLLKSMYDDASGEFSKMDAAVKAGQPLAAAWYAVAGSPGGEVTKATGAMIKAQWDQLVKAHAAYKQGHYSEAMGHTLAAGVPMVGPMAAQAGEEIGTGDPLTMAHGVGSAAAILAPAGLKAAKDTLPAVRVPALAPNKNPVEAAAVDWGTTRGIPVDAATASGNPVVRGAQKAAEHTSLAGSYVGREAGQAQADAFARVGNDLAADVHPAPVTPETAGGGVRDSVTGLIETLHRQANTAYEKVRAFEADPNLSEKVPTAPSGSSAQKSILGKMAVGMEDGNAPTIKELKEVHRMLAELDAVPFKRGKLIETIDERGTTSHYDPRSAGAPVYHDIVQAAPGTADMTRADVIRSIRKFIETGEVTNAAKGAVDVARARLAGSSHVSRPMLPPDAGNVAHVVGKLEDMPLPVDLRGVKTLLRPVYDKLMRQMPIAQQRNSTGIKALENILNGSDYSPFSTADADLSAIKAAARGADLPELKTLSQGTAALAVQHFDEAVRKAVAKAGPDAVRALEEGRSVTAAKHGAGDLLEKIRTEPVQAFQQAIYAKDAGIDLLRQVADHAPSEMPKIGRAFLEDLLSQATADGAFDKAKGLAAKWSNLGPQTKKILFGSDGRLVHELDNFFLLAKKAAENPNPSGSAYVGGLIAHGYLLRDPVQGIVYEIAGGALAKALHSPGVVKALTKGFSVRIGNGAVAAAATANILRAAQDAGIPVVKVAGRPADQPQAKGQP